MHDVDVLHLDQKKLMQWQRVSGVVEVGLEVLLQRQEEAAFQGEVGDLHSWVRL